jgi:hypothetical protein
MKKARRARSDEIQKLLVMAAYYEGARPGSRYHKCAPIIRRALEWAGRWTEQTRQDMKADRENSDIEAFYQALIALIRHQPRAEALMEGQGDFGSPAFPPYTECRLTPKVAERLLDSHAEFRAE